MPFACHAAVHYCSIIICFDLSAIPYWLFGALKPNQAAFRIKTSALYGERTLAVAQFLQNLAVRLHALRYESSTATQARTV